MSTTSIEKHAVHDEEMGAPLQRAITYSLTQEQFETLYLQPGGRESKGDLAKRFANPTPLGVASFLLCLTPSSINLLGINAVTPAATVVLAGPAYFVGGLGLFTAGLLEFVIGNTFPSTVFCTFGSFWFAFGFLVSPSQMIESALTSAVTKTAPDYYLGVATYLAGYAALVVLFFIGSLRTNLVFVGVFFFLELSFITQIIGYIHIGVGTPGDAIAYFKAGGAFGLITALFGWYLLAVLIMGSTGIPLALPVGDMSNFMSPKPAAVKAE